MWLSKNLALSLLFAGLALRVSARDAREKRAGSESAGDERRKSARSGDTSVMKGRFVSGDLRRCTWTATGENAPTVRVTCESGRGDAREELACEYAVKPTRCLERSYWRRISHVLKKQKLLCGETRAPLRTGTCKRKRVGTEVTPTPLTTTVNVTAGFPESTRARGCSERTDHGRLAREKCGESWASFCTLLFTFIQSDEC